MSDEADRLMEMAQQMPLGLPAYHAFKEVVRLREAEGNLDELFYAKLYLAYQCSFSAHETEALSLLVWCVSHYEADRDRFRRHEYLLFRVFSNVTASVSDFYQLSLDQIYALVDRMEQNFRIRGIGARETAYIRLTLAHQTGRPPLAAEAFREYQLQRRDSCSRCQACEANGVIDYLIFLEDYATAIENSGPIFAGHLTCAQIPHVTLATTLRPLALLERYDEADRQQKRGYRLIRSSPSFLKEQALHIAYLRHRKRATAALNIVERHLGWAIETATPLEKLQFFTASRKLLADVAAKKSAVKLTLPKSLPGAQPDGTHQLAPLIDWLDQECSELSSQFDRRNGNTYVSTMLNELLDY